MKSCSKGRTKWQEEERTWNQTGQVCELWWTFMTSSGPSHFKKLDATIKKNTTACKKLGKMTAENEAALLKELQGLNLNRYISEVVSAITTAQIRLVDVPTVVKVEFFFLFSPSRFVPFYTKTMQNSLQNFYQV